MCGIVGFYQHYSMTLTPLHDALTALDHRGPDAKGTWLSPDHRIGLGHTRLSIMDEAGGSQPLMSQDYTIYAVVNGEFYGYKQLRKQLESKGYVFKTHSDSELIIHLYQAFGLDCVHHLRGEFAFILVDMKQQKMIAVRDRFGTKPLCYRYSEQGLWLASEAKALFALTGHAPKWNEYALHHAFYLQYLPLHQTLFDDVHSLAPGTMLLYDGRDISVTSYWDLNYQRARG